MSWKETSDGEKSEERRHGHCGGGSRSWRALQATGVTQGSTSDVFKAIGRQVAGQSQDPMPCFEVGCGSGLAISRDRSKETSSYCHSPGERGWRSLWGVRSGPFKSTYCRTINVICFHSSLGRKSVPFRGLWHPSFPQGRVETLKIVCSLFGILISRSQS